MMSVDTTTDQMEPRQTAGMLVWYSITKGLSPLWQLEQSQGEGELCHLMYKWQTLNMKSPVKQSHKPHQTNKQKSFSKS